MTNAWQQDPPTNEYDRRVEKDGKRDTFSGSVWRRRENGEEIDFTSAGEGSLNRLIPFDIRMG